jgi:poly [ADP-ribose] polymerase
MVTCLKKPWQTWKLVGFNVFHIVTQLLLILSSDVKKMPLGKLSKSQIAKGFEVLEEIEEVVNKKKKGSLAELTSRFYTLVPHAFGRQRPPIIADQETVRKKMDMLLVHVFK